MQTYTLVSLTKPVDIQSLLVGDIGIVIEDKAKRRIKRKNARFTVRFRIYKAFIYYFAISRSKFSNAFTEIA